MSARLSLFTVLLSLACAAPVLASQPHRTEPSAKPAAPKLHLRHGMPLPEARKRILASQWQPNQPPERKKTGEQPLFPEERDLYERGYAEVQSCAMDKAICNFRYIKKRDHKICLLIQTQGEKFRDMKLIYWTTYRCRAGY